MKYTIEGGQLPVVICELENGETMITEGGAMSWMSPNMQMETTSGGGLGRALGRMFAGEALFMNRYTARGGQGLIAYASKLPGEIRAFDIRPGREIIVQKGGFLAAESGVQLSVHFQKRISSGFFGGEGFIMQRLSGSGTAFVDDLAPGQAIVVDSGHLAAMEATCGMEVQMVQGAKNIFFGGEGLFNTVITGPGRVWLQTMPIVNIAKAIIPYIPTKSD